MSEIQLDYIAVFSLNDGNKAFYFRMVTAFIPVVLLRLCSCNLKTE